MFDIEGEPLTREERRLFGRHQRPLPEYALMVEYVPATDQPQVSPEERRHRVDAAKQKVKEGVVRIQQSAEFRNYLIAMSMFHEYSWGNQMLIWLQRPDATLVRGFQGWRELGRWVKASERGITILAPVGPTSETYWVRATDRATWVIRRANGQWGVYRNNKVDKTFKSSRAAAKWLRDQGAVPHKDVIEARSFRDVYVFDIKQTDGKPVPEFKVPVLTGEMNVELSDAMLALLQKRGVAVSFEPRTHLSPEIKGQFMHPSSIWIRPEEAPAQKLKSLIHETAHYYSMGPFGMPRQDAEVIAESVAFVVAAHYGFDTGARSFPYVALWARDEETLNKNLDNIHKVSEQMIEDLEDIEERPPLRPVETVRPEPPPEPAMTLEQMETTYTVERIKEMASKRGLSTSGSKRDIIRRLLG